VSDVQVYFSTYALSAAAAWQPYSFDLRRAADRQGHWSTCVGSPISYFVMHEMNRVKFWGCKHCFFFFYTADSQHALRHLVLRIERTACNQLSGINKRVYSSTAYRLGSLDIIQPFVGKQQTALCATTPGVGRVAPEFTSSRPSRSGSVTACYRAYLYINGWRRLVVVGRRFVVASRLLE
jgi:hypothetical protein